MKTRSNLDLPIEASEWAQLIIDWFLENQRDLPWRRNPDPYWVWLSEVMLQQTQVKTVLPYFEKFIAAYPTVEDLAEAGEAEVLDLWTGLGYYRRARNLHKAAQIICRDFGGSLPRQIDDLLSLPGIGRYSAGAVLSIAYGQPQPVLDGNVKRVLSRYGAVQKPVPDLAFWKLLSEAVVLPSVARQISALNQGLMELGALVCTPRRPDCLSCPLRYSCRGHRLGIASALPKPKPRRKIVKETHTVIVIVRNHHFLMRRNEHGPFLKGFWEFPRLPGRFESSRTLIRKLDSELGLNVRLQTRVVEVKHQITFRRLTFVAVGAVLSSDPCDPRWKWLLRNQRRHPMSAYVRKVLSSDWE